MSAAFDVPAFRARFRSLERLVYLNSGSYGLLADSVAAAFQTYLDTRIRRGADWGGWTEQLEAVRGAVAGLLAATPDEVAITASATAGINAVASALDVDRGRDTILVSNTDFPTGAQIWHAQERAGARIVHVAEAPDGTIPVESFAQAIDDRTRLVALSQLCYRHGARLADDDIRAIARLAHDRGALVLLDSYQIVGTTPVHPRALEVDFAVGGMLKYLLGTAGIGFLYVREGLVDQLQPRSSGWFAQEDIGAMDIFANRPSPTARRFEAGTPPVPSLAPALAGIQEVTGIGLDAIGAQVARVTAYAMARLDEAGIAVSTPRDDARRGPLVAIPARDDHALVAALMERDIVTSCRDGRVRAGFHAYNTEADADALVAALTELRHLLPAPRIAA